MYDPGSVVHKKRSFMARILIVDDEPEIRLLLETFLTKKGHQVILGASGEEALEIISRGEDIDLAVLDDRMPGIKGSEVIEVIRSKGIDFPVIMLTGSANFTSGDVQADAFLRKPIDLNDLMEKVGQMLND